MRRHFYLVVDAPDEDLIGGVDIVDNRYEMAKKNEQQAIQKRNFRTGESFTEALVGLGYHDFEDKGDYEANLTDVVEQKLKEIDEQHLVDAGIDPDEFFDEKEATA